MKGLIKDPVVSKADAQQWGLHCKYQPITVCGPVFADDARWLARTREGIVIAAEISEDYLGFHGGNNNIPKSGIISGTWAGSTDVRP